MHSDLRIWLKCKKSPLSASIIQLGGDLDIWVEKLKTLATVFGWR